MKNLVFSAVAGVVVCVMLFLAVSAVRVIGQRCAENLGRAVAVPFQLFGTGVR